MKSQLNNKAIIILQLLVLILAFSCSGDDDSGSNQQQEEGNLVKTEKVSDDFKADYTYNNDDLLTNWSGIRNGYIYELDFVYDSSDNVTEEHYEESGFGTFTSETYFSYNANGKLIGFDDVELAYNGNVVTVTGDLEGVPTTTVILELNADGLVTSMSEDSTLVVFEYDENENLETINEYQNNVLVATYNMLYDAYNNPFYGQLKSIYLARFMEVFYPFEGVFISGFEGYGFPYQKNNLISISKNAIVTTTYNYSYNSEEYPISISEDYEGDMFSYVVEYY